MMTKTMIIILGMAMVASVPALGGEAEFEGRVLLGGVFMDETGDKSTMQETYNVYEGFAVSSLYLKGRFNPRSFLTFDLTNINQDNRRGYLEYRMPGMFRLYSRYTQSTQVFDPSRATESDRRNFFISARVTPGSLTEITGDYRLITRRGDRIGYPDSVMSNIGERYDYDHHQGRLALQIRTDRVGGTVAVDASSLSDAINDNNDRRGRVLSANVYLPGIWTTRLTHVFRGALGVSELPTVDTKYKMYTGQYTGILALIEQLQFKYRFYGSRVDDEVTAMFTDNFIHDFDLVYRDRWGSAAAGYGWEALDDDRSVTTYNNLRGSLYLRAPGNTVTGSVSFASRDKEDKEKKTLLEDTETSRVRAKLDYKPNSDFGVGGSYAQRTRDLNDLSAKIEGQTAGVYARYYYEYFGDIGVIETNISLNYQYAADDYDNRGVSTYRTRSHFITAKVDGEWEEKLDAGIGVTYMDIGQDLDIEKSVLSFWAGYEFLDRWEVKAKYNVYNYDDFILTNRFYTANIVWFDVGYNFDIE